MATAPRQSAPAPKLPNPAEGFDVFRPFRLAFQFATGAVGGALRGTSKMGSRGAAIGALSGVAWAFANPFAASGVSFLTAVVFGTAGGIGLGLLLGVGVGALMGGFNHAGRAQAREDAVSRARSKAVSQTPSLVSTSEVSDRIDASNFDRQLQQNQELERNQETYWQDRVSQGHGGHGRGF